MSSPTGVSHPPLPQWLDAMLLLLKLLPPSVLFLAFPELLCQTPRIRFTTLTIYTKSLLTLTRQRFLLVSSKKIRCLLPTEPTQHAYTSPLQRGPPLTSQNSKLIAVLISDWLSNPRSYLGFSGSCLDYWLFGCRAPDSPSVTYATATAEL